MIEISIEKLIPHRNGMKLVDEVIEADDEMAVTASVVTEQWPLFEDNCVNVIVLIELVAQTAGVCRGWKDIKENPGETSRMGWIVGIKKAKFFIDKIPLNTRIITTSQNSFTFDNYLEISGTAKIGSEVAGEIILQIYGAENP